jgi:hypothetical protein
MRTAALFGPARDVASIAQRSISVKENGPDCGAAEAKCQHVKYLMHIP